MLTNPAAANPEGELDAFAANIEARFNGRSVGFGYAIFKDGNYVRGGGGGLREKTQAKDLAFNQSTQKDCHSMSKTITAAAMIRALQLRNLDLGDTIFPYFPKNLQDMVPANGDARNITFEEMLGHRSGITDSARTWAELRVLLGNLSNGSPKTYDYSNWNYGMCRLLIPYVMNLGFYRDMEANNASIQTLDGLTADAYVDFVRAQILTPAGATQNRTRPPQNPTASNFAYLYDFRDDIAVGIMPDRHFDIGSGGWALSARGYGKFLSALVGGNLIGQTVRWNGNPFTNTLQLMRARELGMFATEGSGGEIYYDHRGGNTWSGNGFVNSAGGQSVWMHFPSNNMVAVVQINSHKNDINGAGIDRKQHLREAYDEVYSTPAPHSFRHEMNLFCGRGSDGWFVSRGIRGSGSLNSTNFDAHLETGWTDVRFYRSGGLPYVLFYQSNYNDNFGRILVRQVGVDGTLGNIIFNSNTAHKGWDQLEIFHKNGGLDTFLVMFDKSDRKIQTYRIGNDGKPTGQAIADGNLSEAYTVMEILELDGEDYLFLHRSFNGTTRVRSLTGVGTIGEIVYDKVWNTGYDKFAFYRTGNAKTFLFRYDSVAGRARTIKFTPTVAGLNQTTQIFDADDWTKGWTAMKFFRIDGRTYNFRYNRVSGWVRIQEIEENGLFGSRLPLESDGWMRKRDDDRTLGLSGWDLVEFYDSDIAPSQLPLPDGNQGGSYNGGDLSQGNLPPNNPSPVEIKPARVTTSLVSGLFQLAWQPSPGVLYVVESSEDMVEWRPINAFEERSAPIQWLTDIAPVAADGKVLRPREFFRVRTVEAAPTASSRPAGDPGR